MRTPRSLRPFRAGRAAFPLAAAVLSAGIATPSQAATRAWNAGSSNWSTASNWTGNAVPAALDAVTITETDGVSRTITYDYAGSNLTLTSLTINLTAFSAPNTTTFSMPANILTATNEYVGNSGTGTNGTGAFIQSGGINTAAASLYLGFNATDQGFYTLTGNSTLAVTTNEYVGYNGIGSFTQSGGNVSIKGATDLFLGNNAGSSGSYTLSAGTLAVGGGEVVGNLGSGNFTQTGGANTIASFGFYVGLSSLGNYSLSGNGTIASSANEYIGFNSNGNFTQNGGTNTINSASLYLANGTTSSGTYTLNLGNLTVAGIGYIGFGGAAVFNQNGGNFTITGANSLIIANSAGSSGAFNLSGGNTTITGNVYVGGSLTAGGTGILTVSGSSVLSITGALTAYNTTSTSINLNGGTINASALNFNGIPALFSWTAGTLNLTANVTWDSAAAANATAAAFGAALNLSGNQSLLVTGNETLGGTGPFSLTLNPGSTHTVTGNITLNPNGAFTQLPGSTFSTNTFTQAGGTINGTLQNPVAFIYQSGAFNGRLINLGTVTLGRSFTAGNGIENDTLLSIASGQSVTVNGQGLANDGTLTLAGGTLNGAGPLTNFATFTGCGTISGTGGLINFGVLSTTPGLTVFSNTGGLQNQPGGSVYLAGGFLFKLSAAAITNDGNFNLNSGTLLGAGNPGEQLTNNADGVLTGPGVISVPLANFGMIYVSAGSLNVPAFTNNGVIEIAGNSANLNAAAAITNAATLEGNGKVSAAIINAGTIESTGGGGGTLAFSGALTNTATGTLRADTNTKILLQGASTFPANAGLISLVGGTFDTGGLPLINNGQITGYGILATGGGGLTNNANITFTGGTSTINGPVTNAANQTINIKFQPAIFTGNITNNGTILVTNTTVTFTGTYTGNAYLSDPSTNIFQNNVTILPGGSMTGSAGDTFHFSAGNVTNNGTFTNAGTLLVNANITNAGTFTQSGPQSWSATSTFTNLAGKTTFQSNAKLANLTITAGTVDTTTSKLIIQPTAATKSATLAALRENIATGSLISGNLPPHAALALIDNAVTNFTTFGGMPADSGSILLAPELLGDANIDGHVDLTDLNTLLNHLGTPTPSWTDGNFDHAPTIDLTDLNAVLNNLGLTFANPTQLPITIYQLPVSPTPTPEPTSLSLALGLAAFVASRRSRPDRRAS